MTLHPAVARDLLEAEAESVRQGLGDRVEVVEVESLRVLIRPKGWGGRWLCLDGALYDQHPLRVSVLDADRNPTEDWPGNLKHPNRHAILNEPWACILGTYQYHTWPGHAAETWDQYRTRIRMLHLVRHILKNAGA